MPTSESTVGGLELPVPPGLINTKLDDPAIYGLLDYLAFWLNWSLTDKFANMQGTSAVPVPTNNRYPYDPNANFVRNPIPALYVWSDRTRIRQRTLLRWYRERRVRAMYVFNELVSPMGMRARAGLLEAVDAVFARAAQWGRHREYGYNGAEPGTSIAHSTGMMSWDYVEGEKGGVWKIPGTTEGTPARVGTGGDGSVQRLLPVVKAEFRVDELIGFDQPINLPNYPNDLSSDMTMVISTGDTTEDVVDVREGILPYPDGTEVPP